MHVPLVVSNPKLFPQAVHTDALASTVDLMPTLATLAGRAATRTRGRFRGRDLTPDHPRRRASTRDKPTRDGAGLGAVHHRRDHRHATSTRCADGRRSSSSRRTSAASARRDWKFAMYFDPQRRRATRSTSSTTSRTTRTSCTTWPTRPTGRTTTRAKVAEMQEKLAARMAETHTTPGGGCRERRPPDRRRPATAPPTAAARPASRARRPRAPARRTAGSTWPAPSMRCSVTASAPGHRRVGLGEPLRLRHRHGAVRRAVLDQDRRVVRRDVGDRVGRLDLAGHLAQRRAEVLGEERLRVPRRSARSKPAARKSSSVRRNEIGPNQSTTAWTCRTGPRSVGSRAAEGGDVAGRAGERRQVAAGGVAPERRRGCRRARTRRRGRAASGRRP